MTRERFNSLPKMGRYPATRSIRGKRTEKVKTFIKRINEELKEMVQLITQVKTPINLKIQKKEFLRQPLPKLKAH
jgi:hypothetical protein